MFAIFKERLLRHLPAPSQRFIGSLSPAVNTPDIALLEKKEYHWMFDHSNVVQTPCAFNEAYTEENFAMFLRNHEAHTPHLIFNDNINSHNSRKARIKGKLHLVTPNNIQELDKRLGNRVELERKKVRLILPFYKESRVEKTSQGIPAQTTAWIYVDRKDTWGPRFEFDFSLWRNREDSAYLPAKVFKDNRPWINNYFVPTQKPAHSPKCNIGFRHGTQYRVDLAHEEKEYFNKLRDDARDKQSNSGTTYQLPQVS